MITILLNAGASICAVTKESSTSATTALHIIKDIISAYVGYSGPGPFCLSVVTILLDAGSSISAVTKEGFHFSKNGIAKYELMVSQHCTSQARRNIAVVTILLKLRHVDRASARWLSALLVAAFSNAG